MATKTSWHRKMRRTAGANLENLWELSESLRRPVSDVFRITAVERHTQQKLTMLYIGGGENLTFLTNLIGESREMHKIKSQCLSITAPYWVKRYGHTADLLIVDLELFYCKLFWSKEWMAVPQWVRQKLEIPNTWPELLAKFRKNTKKTDLRKIRKYKLGYRLSKKESDFRDFYHHMYKPYLQKRFADEVLIEPEWKVLRQCRKGELLQIIRHDEIVAAALLHSSEGRLAYVWVGVPENVSDEMYKGAFSGLYYYTILHGFNLGCQEVDFLGSRPLLNDGLFRYKRKWGTLVQDSPVPRGDILIKANPSSEPVKSFLRHNLFIVRQSRGLNGQLFYDDKPLEAEKLAFFINRYFTRGLNKLKIICGRGIDASTQEQIATMRGKITLVDLIEKRSIC